MAAENAMLQHHCQTLSALFGPEAQLNAQHFPHTLHYLPSGYVYPAATMPAPPVPVAQVAGGPVPIQAAAPTTPPAAAGEGFSLWRCLSEAYRMGRAHVAPSTNGSAAAAVEGQVMTRGALAVATNGGAGQR